MAMLLLLLVVVVVARYILCTVLCTLYSALSTVQSVYTRCTLCTEYCNYWLSEPPDHCYSRHSLYFSTWPPPTASAVMVVVRATQPSPTEIDKAFLDKQQMESSTYRVDNQEIQPQPAIHFATATKPVLPVLETLLKRLGKIFDEVNLGWVVLTTAVAHVAIIFCSLLLNDASCAQRNKL